MKSNPLFVWLGLSAACAACCAPLLLPLFAGAGLAGAGWFAGGRLFGLPLDVTLCGAIFVAVVAGITLWWRQVLPSQSAKSCACEASCDVESCGSEVRS